MDDQSHHWRRSSFLKRSRKALGSIAGVHEEGVDVLLVMSRVGSHFLLDTVNCVRKPASNFARFPIGYGEMARAGIGLSPSRTRLQFLMPLNPAPQGIRYHFALSLPKR